MSKQIILPAMLVILPGISPLFAQTPANSPPHWLDLWRNVTVSIGQIKKADVQQDDGSTIKKDIFDIVGTGVLFYSRADTLANPVLVTAKHNLFEPSEGWNPDYLQARVASFDDKPVDQYFGFRISLRKDTLHLWIPHPNPKVDLACIPVLIPEEDLPGKKVQVVPYNAFATKDQIFEGASIAVLGYPGAVSYNFWSKAILREGIVAWVSPVDPQSNVILIDCNVFPGNSGGSVFKLPFGMNRLGGLNVGDKPAFLGLISEGRIQKLSVLGAGKRIVLPTDKRPLPLSSGHYMAIGVVESALRVSQLLDHAFTIYSRK